MMRRVFGILLMVVALYLAVPRIGGFFTERRPEHPYYANLPVGTQVHAHGGGQHLRPDNTMLAFEHAAELGAHVLELDINITKDGELVVLHDTTVDRTTDGSGNVVDFTLSEILALDGAYNWRPPGGAAGEYPYRGQGVTIPLLRDVFAAFPGQAINVEMKSPDARMPGALCDLITETGREHTVLVASFIQEHLYTFRELCPAVATSAGPDEAQTFVIMNYLGLGRLWSPAMESFQVPMKQGSIPVVNTMLRRGLAERNVRLDVWTINDAETMNYLIDIRADGIITDVPDLALSLLDF